MRLITTKPKRRRTSYYKATPTLSAFHLSDKLVRGVLGPFGSGKSSGCVAECMRRMEGQAPWKGTDPRPGDMGTRYTKGIVARNTYRELTDTVIPIWDEWLGGMGELKQGTMIWRMERPASRTQPGCVHEVLFRSFDKPKDLRKVLSLNITWGWINEAREVPLAAIEGIQGRLGRFPPVREGGPTWRGMWMDTNPPDEMSWWYELFEKRLPEQWELFRQPGGREAGAENVENLPEAYYTQLASGKSDAWCKVYIDGQYGFVGEDGMAIYQSYQDGVHSKRFDIPDSGTLYVGIDFGLTPAAVMGVRDASGSMRIRHEYVTYDTGAARFAIELFKFLSETYPPHRWTWVITGDPAGEQRAQTDENTPFKVLRQAGLMAHPAYTNDFTIRVDAIGLAMRTLTMTGEPALVVHIECRVLRIACNGGYRLRRLQIGGTDKFATEPDKNQYSHVAEALQYLMLGAGEGRNVVTGGAGQWTPIVHSEHRRRARAKSR